MRYELTTSLEEIWVVDLQHPARNPVFRLAGSDEKHARRLLRNLNREVSAEKRPSVNGHERRATALSSTL